MITANALREKYLEFFKSKGHNKIAGKSLIPENDPTVLFTTAGMHPLVPYILGESHPAGKRLVNVQKCIRTQDIDEVGDATHLTFFEMLGNWSLGDYFKHEAINYSYEFITLPRWLGLSTDSLAVTVFQGDDQVPADEESAAIWRSLGIADNRIYYLPRQDNWWGPAGQTGPCGPDTEMFIDTGQKACSSSCRPGCRCGKYFEIWNDVFMQYNKTQDGRYEPLQSKTVDTGMGVERTITMLQGKKSVYDTELFVPIIAKIEEMSAKTYLGGQAFDNSFRIVADHIRAATFILGDENNIKPGREGQGYVLRRLIRRAIRHARKLEMGSLSAVAEVVIDNFKQVYTELEDNHQNIIRELADEEGRFLEALKNGEQEFQKKLPGLLKNPRKIISGRVAFDFYQTYGFPLEIFEELAAENGLGVDRQGFEEAYAKHIEVSKAGEEKKFKGGLADHGEAAKRLHTATHLLHKALKMVLGEHIAQKGSNITAERLRFDFTYPDKMSDEQIKEVEHIVNAQIERGLEVIMEVMELEQARLDGAIALFGDKYEAKVKVYAIGDFSKEVCGGPHVANTRELGQFVIQKEQSSSAGVRRIRAVLQ